MASGRLLELCDMAPVRLVNATAAGKGTANNVGELVEVLGVSAGNAVSNSEIEIVMFGGDWRKWIATVGEEEDDILGWSVGCSLWKKSFFRTKSPHP